MELLAELVLGRLNAQLAGVAGVVGTGAYDAQPCVERLDVGGRAR